MVSLDNEGYILKRVTSLPMLVKIPTHSLALDAIHLLPDTSFGRESAHRFPLCNLFVLLQMGKLRPNQIIYPNHAAT
jgi:hypothetical protein